MWSYNLALFMNDGRVYYQRRLFYVVWLLHCNMRLMILGLICRWNNCCMGCDSDVVVCWGFMVLCLCMCECWYVVGVWLEMDGSSALSLLVKIVAGWSEFIMDWWVAVCGCGGGELFGYWLSILNDCSGVSWLRSGVGWSGFVLSWGKVKFISSSFFVFGSVFVCLFWF